MTWAHTFDFRESAGGFTPLVRSGSDYRAVYTSGVGFTHGSPYTNVIQIQSAFLAQTTLTKIKVTLSEAVVPGEYLQVCETADSCSCWNVWGGQQQ